jgi:hypothetical protein
LRFAATLKAIRSSSMMTRPGRSIRIFKPNQALPQTDYLCLSKLLGETLDDDSDPDPDPDFGFDWA